MERAYGLTIINSNGFYDGTESSTSLFHVKENRDAEAYNYYKILTSKDDAEYKNIENRILSKKKFFSELENGLVLIQYSNHHIQIETFSQMF